MANNLGYTQGTGAEITTVQASSDGSHVQVVALSAIGATGDRSPLPTSATLGLGVQVLGVGSGVTFPVVNNGSTKLVVDGSQVNQPVINATSTTLGVNAAVGSPVAVRVSNGSAFVDTIPVNIQNSSVTVAGTVAISGTPAVTQSGVWNIGTVGTITNPVTITGTVSLGATATVAGTVTATQGTAAALAGAWPTKITDGTNSVGTQTVSSKVGLNVVVLGGSGLGYSQQDKTAFTEGTTFVEVIGGVYNDAFSSSPSAGQASVLRITPNRAAHANLRRQDGTEVGTTANPLYVQASTANFPINVVQIGGVPVVSAAAGVQQVGITDGAGNLFKNTNPLCVTPAPNPGTFWRQHIAYTASQTAQSIHTPASGKTAFVQGLILTPTAGGNVTIYDQTDSATSELFDGTLPASGVFPIMFSPPVPLSAINNLLRYNTGSGAAGDLVAWGYDA